MGDEIFNPFEDRFSRDLRNELSSALAKAIETGDRDQLEKVVEKYQRQDLAPHYRDYLEERSKRFNEALCTIKREQDPIEQAVILWNQELFFEVHEVLEHAWYSAEGEHKLTLQAIIRAAGSYVKKDCGYLEPAKKIAGKSWPVLLANREFLNNFFDPAPLIAALKNPDLDAPKLQVHKK